MVSFIVIHCTHIDFELLTEDLSNAPWHVGEIFTEIDDSIQLSHEEEVNIGGSIYVDAKRRSIYLALFTDKPKFVAILYLFVRMLYL